MHPCVTLHCSLSVHQLLPNLLKLLPLLHQDLLPSSHFSPRWRRCTLSPYWLYRCTALHCMGFWMHRGNIPFSPSSSPRLDVRLVSAGAGSYCTVTSCSVTRATESSTAGLSCMHALWLSLQFSLGLITIVRSIHDHYNCMFLWSIICPTILSYLTYVHMLCTQLMKEAYVAKASCNWPASCICYKYPQDQLAI